MFGCCKTFSGKYIFSGNANFRKRKIFPCVWLHFKKFFGKYFLVFGKEEGKHNPEKTQTQFKFFLLDLSPVRSREGEIAINSAILPSRSTAREEDPRLRSTDGEIAPSIVISRRRRDRDRVVDRDRRCDLAKARSRSSRDRAVDRDLDPVRSHEGEIAIDGKIAIFVRSRHRLRSRSGAISRRRDRDQRRLECLPTRLRSARTGDRALSLSLSLSLSSFFGNTLKGK